MEGVKGTSLWSGGCQRDEVRVTGGVRTVHGGGCPRNVTTVDRGL